MQLLIIKSGTGYLRFKDDKIIKVSLDKASVFPMSQMSHVRTLEARAQTQGFDHVRIKKLVLTEADLSKADLSKEAFS